MESKSRLASDPGPLGVYSDAARRLSDAVSLHMTVSKTDAVGRWVASRLSDGWTDGSLYDTKRDAMRHTTVPELYCFVKIPFEGMNYQEAEIFLNYNRQLYDNGYRMPDPESEGFR